MRLIKWIGLLTVLIVVVGLVGCGGEEKPQIVHSNTTQTIKEIPGFKYLKEETFSCGGQANTMKIYLHEKTGLEFVLVPRGSYQMGSEFGDKDEIPEYTFKIESFLICRTECTQDAWERVMGTKPWKDKEFVKEGNDYPASYLSWFDCLSFCKKTGLEIPLNWHWDYACRAGTSTDFCFGDLESELGDYAWYAGNTWNAGNKYPHRIRQKKANAFGLYDIHGNVCEWCHSSPMFHTSLRAVYGGAWGFDSYLCANDYGFVIMPDSKHSTLGFRPTYYFGKSYIPRVIDSDAIKQSSENMTVNEAVSLIEKGMTEHEVDMLLRPVEVARGQLLSLHGCSTKYFELKGNKELEISFSDSEVTSVGEIAPLSEWKRWKFLPDDNELFSAIKIAFPHLKHKIAQKEGLTAPLLLSIKDGVVSMDLKRDLNLFRHQPLPLIIQSSDGQEVKFYVGSEGFYSTHRLVGLYFYRNDEVIHSVIVDMDDKTVVPGRWEPTSEEIAMARKIADPSIVESLGFTDNERVKVKVKAGGYYDYGPTRRRIYLTYHKRGAIIDNYAYVDIDNGTLLQGPAVSSWY